MKLILLTRKSKKFKILMLACFLDESECISKGGGFMSSPIKNSDNPLPSGRSIYEELNKTSIKEKCYGGIKRF